MQSTVGYLISRIISTLLIYIASYAIQPASGVAQSAGKPILVDVFAPWCPTCKAQQKVLAALKDKPAYDALVVFKVDYDNQGDAVKSFNARQQSTLIAYKGAAETGRSVGDTDPQSIEALLMTALK